MKQLIQWVALTFVLTLLATIGALMIERAQPQTVSVPGFDRCDGDPCFDGIAPGKTSVIEAMQRVLTDYGLSPVSVYSKYVTYPLDDNTGLTIRYSSFASVDNVSMEAFAGVKLTTLGQLVMLLGPPTTVGFSTAGVVIFCFPSLCVENFRSSTMPVTVDWPITLMTYAPVPSKFMTGNRPWHGFGIYVPN